ncbi:MAG: hypothetical protein JWP11_1434 [Frankiales bacterium]|nr:hypothetical protein [Frankiales bacterium]
MTRPPLRQVLGGAFALLGVAALFLGWWGVSGAALTAKQVPYLVSGGLSGVCLLVLAAACFATDDIRRRLDRLDEVERKVDLLYRLLTEEDVPASAEEELVALDGGRSYHRRSCRLVQGKAAARTLQPPAAAERGLTPCALCEPPGLRVA